MFSTILFLKNLGLATDHFKTTSISVSSLFITACNATVDDKSRVVGSSEDSAMGTDADVESVTQSAEGPTQETNVSDDAVGQEDSTNMSSSEILKGQQSTVVLPGVTYGNVFG